MKKYLFLTIIPVLLFLAGCSEKTNMVEPASSQNESGLYKQELPKEVRDQLQALKAATAKYHNIENAYADGYVDINVVVPHMGTHLLNPAYLDSTFDVTHPELLVYEQTANGHYKLVAIEFAVPVEFPMPEGFAGSYDQWVVNTDFNIWTLHAWVWKDNPDGVFAPFNPNVP